MKLIWTKKDIFRGGDLITWAFNQDCSHFALAFFDETVFFHSSLGGVHILDNEDFYKSRVKVHEIIIEIDPYTEAELLKAISQEHIRKGYDYKFFFWLVWLGFKKKILGMDYHKKITRQDPDSFICHEVYQLVNEVFQLSDPEEFEKAVMPHDLWEIVK